jgi:penicillin-binding protein 1C
MLRIEKIAPCLVMKRLIKYKWHLAGTFILLLCIYYFILPKELFHDPYATILEDSTGELLSASIASDGQWRFPEMSTVPDKFYKALVTYEDKRFRNHPGVDILALLRAAKQNIQHAGIVSGGSTITMQVIRLSRKRKPRTFSQKLMEIILATRLELRYTKDEILSLYASHAPFGGNAVGFEAACWRYFGRNPQELSWGEAALLAVLPNAPSLIHPGRNRNRLKVKRDLLLDKLNDEGIIDAFTCSLSKDEPIPDEPHPLPRLARHLLGRVSKAGHAEMKVRSTIQSALQLRVEQIVNEHHQRLKGNQIFNAAALVVEVNTGNVLAYVGNADIKEKGSFSESVDIVTAPRSTGSILKPFLYAAMLDAGKILPRTLLPDVPTMISGFSPKNFSKDYDGAVAADKSLIRSLNIPAVHMLRTYRYEKFHSLLGNIGMRTLIYPPDHYGLSLILGGAEGTLWDITGMYASMARTLIHYFDHPGKNRYDRSDFHELNFLQRDQSKDDAGSTLSSTDVLGELEETSWLSAASIYQTFDALKEVYRPGEESGWRYFNSSKKIAWKTGTSFGFRDGWAIGVTPDYVVGVWVGNASGEGRPGLTGTEAAAPVMFDIFSQLDGQRWFRQPFMELNEITVCALSGQRSTSMCSTIDTAWVTKQGLQSLPCPYHKAIHVSADKKFRVHSGCERVDRQIEMTWFILPPSQEYYFRTKHMSYKPLPPFRNDCQPISLQIAMDLIYPKPNARIFIPRELNGKAGNAVFELAHRNPNTTVHWHLDGVYLGSTLKSHHFPLNPGEGKHTLVLVDENGEALEQRFEVLSKM